MHTANRIAGDDAQIAADHLRRRNHCAIGLPHRVAGDAFPC
jgi:hypothetical protein